MKLRGCTPRGNLPERMIRREISLLGALLVMGGVIFWITQPQDPDTPGTPDPREDSLPASAKVRPVHPVAAIKAENSLLVGPAPERVESTERLWDTAIASLLPALVSVQSHHLDKNQNLVVKSSTGLLVSAEGHLICPDTLVEDARALRVRLADGTVEAARVLALDRCFGIALIQIRRTDVKSTKWGNPSLSEKVERYLVAGRWAAGGEWFSTALLASPVSTEASSESLPPLDRLLVFDAPLPEGSGAVVADRRGHVVAWARAEDPHSGSSRYLAVPGRYIETSVAQMIKQGRPSRAQLGAMIQALDRDTIRAMGLEKMSGVLVSDVLPGMAAASAGIEPGDVVLSAGGFKIGAPRDLRAIMAQIPTDQAIPVEVWRKGEVRPLSVVPSTLQPPYSSDAGTLDPFPGESILKSLTLRGANNGGLEVGAFRADQVVASASILPGDRLLEVEGNAVVAMEDVARVLEATASLPLLRLRVESAGVRRYLTLKRL
jgi:S1-C subfamily serine protease